MRQPARTSALVLVNGLPGTGKTTIGRKLADHFGWPFISKDIVKELIFDGLGWSNKQWSLKVSATTHRIMDYLIEEELKAGHSIVVESNFKPELDTDRFEQLRSRFEVAVVQLLCWAEGAVLFDRYWARVGSSRHPGHVESATKEEQRLALAPGRCRPLAVSGHTIEVDTTHFDQLEFDALFAQVSAAFD